MNLPDQLIRRALEPFGVSVDARLGAQVRAYVEVLLFWNQKISLTAVVDPGEILRRHFGESMFAASRVRPGSLLVDLGSGAGFPGLALKLVLPSVRVILVEANAKKAVFLSEVVRKLNLDEVEVRRQRMETVSTGELNADYVTSRAVGNHGSLLAWARPRMSDGGEILLWLGKSDCAVVRGTVGWSWEGEDLIPGSDGRYLLVGRVSRET